MGSGTRVEREELELIHAGCRRSDESQATPASDLAWVKVCRVRIPTGNADHAGGPREEGFYPSGLTDKQWALIEPLLPAPHWDGRKEKHPRRQIVDAILYVARTGCPWRQLTSEPEGTLAIISR